MDKLNATKEEWKLRAMGTTIGCHTIVKKGTEGNCLSFHATITPYRRKYPDLLIRFLFYNINSFPDCYNQNMGAIITQGGRPAGGGGGGR